MVKIKKIYNNIGWILLVVVLGFISTIMCLYNVRVTEYKQLYILPLTFILCTLICSDVYLNPAYKYGIGFWSINVIMLCKYIITPLSIVITNVYGRMGPDPSHDSFKLAYILIVYEILANFILIFIFYKFSKNKKLIKSNDKPILFKNKFVICLFLLISFIFLIRYPGSIIPKNLFIIKTNGGETLNEFQSTGVITILSESFKLVLFLLTISFFQKKYSINPKKIYPILSLITLILFIGLKTSHSRWGVVLNAVVGSYILIQIFPRYRNLIFISVVSIVSISFISISIYKFYYMLGDSDNQILEVIQNMLTMFEDYFSGPRLVAQAIETKILFNYEITISTFINDFLITLPILNDLVTSPFNLSNMYFNAYNLGVFTTPWLILPMIGQGYMYFGLIGAPIFIILCQCFALIFDYMSLNTTKYEIKYILCYASIWFSLSITFCTQIVFTWIFSSFIVLYILFKINSIIVLRRKRWKI